MDTASPRASYGEASAGHVNCWNMANMLLYGLNLALATAAAFRAFGDPLHVLFVQYPTLVTPAELALRIFPVIFAFEAIFVLAQLTPWFRNNPLVMIITPMWVMKSLFQAQWVVELSQGESGNIAYSLLCVFGMLGSLLGLILVVDARKLTFFEFWLLRAPFSIHAGWLIVCTVVNVNMWVASLDTFPDSILLCVAMLSLAWVFVLTALFGINTRRPDPLLCIPVAWAMWYIWRRGDRALPNLPQEMITSVEIASMHCWTGVVVLGICALFARMYMVCVSNRKLPEAMGQLAQGNYEGAMVSMASALSKMGEEDGK